LYRLSIKYAFPLPMHMQWHPESVEQLSALLKSDPRGVVLLSHCGKDTKPDQIRAFFESHANVLCDLGYRSLPQTASENTTEPDRTIYWGDGLFRKAGAKPEWLKLIEDYPDRFMLAVDDMPRSAIYDDIIQSIRTGLLPNLTNATAEKVAYKNALRVFRFSND